VPVSNPNRTNARAPESRQAAVRTHPPIHPALRQIALETAARRRQWIGRRTEQAFLALGWLALGLTLLLALAGPLAELLQPAPAAPWLTLLIGGGLGAVLLHTAAHQDSARLSPAWLAALPISPAQIDAARQALRRRRGLQLAGLYAVLPLLALPGGLQTPALPALYALAAGGWLLATLLHRGLSMRWPPGLKRESAASIGTVAPLHGTARAHDGPLPTLRLWQRRVARDRQRRWLAWGWLLPIGVLLPIGSGLIGLIGLGLAGLSISASLATLAQTRTLLADATRLLASQPLEPHRHRDAAAIVPWRVLLAAALAGGLGLVLLGLPWPMGLGYVVLLASASSYRLALTLRFPADPGRQRRHALLAGALGVLLLREAAPLALLFVPLAAGWQWRQAGR
jgi:hypothetical protein